MLLGYVRVSTADQCKDGRSSLQTQTDIIEGLARARGVDKYDVQIYEDAGVSGATKLKMRPAGERLLQDMKAGDVVVASKLDRMFRSASDALGTLKELKDQGVALHMIDLGGDVCGNGISKLVFTILSAVAENERERIRDVKRDRASQRLFNGGRRPFGYDIDGESKDRRLVPNANEQAALKHGRGMQANGDSLAASRSSG